MVYLEKKFLSEIVWYKIKNLEKLKILRVFSHIRPLGAAGALAVDICICFHDIES